ncbi:carbohydrate ABC transporter permease [Pseudactinotalea terrae]|uniref:carbohydrate ABC transporter permease n=1 Tax=Pseudactinotalea terrae TaxID=1743262 RepID=UPI001F4F574B|nr:sugar ABC transporter permease [Pseudactinotalea terrae]
MTTVMESNPDVLRSEAPPPGRKARRPRQQLWIWLMLLPTVVLYGLYTVYPIVASYWLAFLEWNGFTAEKTFVGLENFQAVLADPLFWNSFRITVIFMLAVVPPKVILTLLLALALNSANLPFRTFFRTAYFLPVVTTAAIVGIVMQFVFDPASGPVNLALRRLGIIDAGINFLGDSSYALWTAAGVYVWKWFGITMIYWLAALQTIPDEVYEAARIDGAGAWQLMKSITLPLLKPFLIIITLLSFESALKVFDLMLTMTNGGPFYATEVVEIYIYRWAFAATVPQLGHASAAAVIFGLFVCVVGLFQIFGVRSVQKARAI